MNFRLSTFWNNLQEKRDNIVRFVSFSSLLYYINISLHEHSGAYFEVTRVYIYSFILGLQKIGVLINYFIILFFFYFYFYYLIIILYILLNIYIYRERYNSIFLFLFFFLLLLFIFLILLLLSSFNLFWLEYPKVNS